MRHFLVVGEKGELFGFAVENAQLVGQIVRNQGDSAYQTQDFYSNNLGSTYYKYYYDSNKAPSETLKTFFEDRAKNK